jgi:thioredoxin-dependent peroxiredoxin
MRLVIILVVLLFAGVLVVAIRPRLARAEMLKPGDSAPEFSTDAVIGEQTTPVRLSDYHGRPVVLYFYPKDFTPGCTKEACAFRDGYAKLQGWGIVVLGCSIDSADSHRAFARKYHLPFPLLLDPDKKIARAYGADNGIPILGLDRRVTYVVGGDGHILKVYPQVDPSAHATEIIHDLGADQPPPAPTPSASPSPAVGAAHPAPAKPASRANDPDTE